MDESGDGVVICTVYPNQRDSEGCRGGSSRRNRDNDDVDDVSVHFQVRVPANIEFEAQMVNGDVSATGLVADAEVSTVNGDVDVRMRRVGM